MELANVSFHRPIWVKQGEQFHQIEEQLWRRRKLSRFNLQSGKTHHNLMMRDNKLGLHGIVDMAIETDTVVHAVEFKISAGNKKRGDQLQLSAYAMLLENYFSKPSPIGFLVGQEQALYTIDIDVDKRRSVMEVSNKIRQILQRGLKPESSASVAQCCVCEYVNFCNDRL